MNSLEHPCSTSEQLETKMKCISLNPDNFGLPRIYAGNKDLASAVRETLDALHLANSPVRIFSRGSSIVRIGYDETGAPQISKLGIDGMRGEAARAAEYYTFKGDDEIPAFPPLEVIRDIMSLPWIEFPPLKRITRSPIFAADGIQQTCPGYNPAANIYYYQMPGFVLPSVSQNPSALEVTEARRLLIEELLFDFPFTNRSDLANAIALILQQPAREMISGPTPLYGIDKPTPGTGASLLCDTLAYVISGERPSNMSAPPDESEMRRTLFSMLLSSPEMLIIDNVGRVLDSAALSAITTSEYYVDRRVGSSDVQRVPNRCACVITGNNLQFSKELSRRTIQIRMDAKMERPYERSEKDFKHPDLRGWVSENRPQLVWAVLTLIQNWVARGRPKFNGHRLGSFESWSDIIGGILECAEIPGFLENRENFYDQTDSETALWTKFLLSWWDKYRDCPVKAGELVVCADGFGLGDGSDHSAATRLGTLLQKKRDCIIGGLQITEATVRKGYPQWKLMKADRGIESPEKQ